MGNLNTKPVESDVNALNLSQSAKEEILELLVNWSGDSPLLYALLKGASKEVVEMLLSAYPDGVKENRYGDLYARPLHIALDTGASKEVVEMLLSAYPDGVKEYFPALPLHHALATGASKEVVEMLLSAYPDGVKEKLVDLPLHIALKKGASKEVVEMLLSAYPDGVKERDEDGYLPLHYALMKGGMSKEILSSFLLYDFEGVNFCHNIASPIGFSMLVDSSSKYDADTVLYLVDYIFKKFRNHAVELSKLKDDKGREIRHIADSRVLKVIKCYTHFLGEYEIYKSVHTSATSKVVLAYQDDGLKIANVALKFFKIREQYKREIDSRVGLDEKYLLPVLRHFDGDDDESLRNALESFGFFQYKHVIVMPASEKSLTDMILHDTICASMHDVRSLFKELCLCVAHLHESRRIHGDLKPLNIVKTDRGKIILIDMDASVKFGEVCGVKLSSAYLPPEMWHKTQLCSSSGETLWKTDIQDNLAEESEKIELYHWTDDIKFRKLEKLNSSSAPCRDLIYQLLSKNPTKRPDLPHILTHPFVTGLASSCRLVSEKAEYDIFLSYRVASDEDVAEALYLKLSKLGLKVWWDKKSLEYGKNWEVSLIQGLAMSDHFMPILSRGAINSENKWQNFSQLEPDSPCDNVLLEHRLALELHRRGQLGNIYPVLVGDKGNDAAYSEYTFKGQNSCHPSFTDSVCVQSVEEKAIHYISDMGMGCPYDLGKTVDSVLADLTKFQGFKLKGYLYDAVNEVASLLVIKMRKLNDSKIDGEKCETTEAVNKLTIQNQRLLEENGKVRNAHDRLLEENGKVRHAHEKLLEEIAKLREDIDKLSAPK